jgi:hypothetical protein
MKIEVIAVRGALISSSIYEVRLPAKLLIFIKYSDILPNLC